MEKNEEEEFKRKVEECRKRLYTFFETSSSEVGEQSREMLPARQSAETSSHLPASTSDDDASSDSCSIPETPNSEDAIDMQAQPSSPAESLQTPSLESLPGSPLPELIVEREVDRFPQDHPPAFYDMLFEFLLQFLKSEDHGWHPRFSDKEIDSDADVNEEHHLIDQRQTNVTDSCRDTMQDIGSDRNVTQEQIRISSSDQNVTTSNATDRNATQSKSNSNIVSDANTTGNQARSSRSDRNITQILDEIGIYDRETAQDQTAPSVSVLNVFQDIERPSRVSDRSMSQNLTESSPVYARKTTQSQIEATTSTQDITEGRAEISIQEMPESIIGTSLISDPESHKQSKSRSISVLTEINMQTKYDRNQILYHKRYILTQNQSKIRSVGVQTEINTDCDFSQIQSPISPIKCLILSSIKSTKNNVSSQKRKTLLFNSDISEENFVLELDKSLTRDEEENLEHESNQSVTSPILGGLIRQSQTQEKTRINRGIRQDKSLTRDEEKHLEHESNQSVTSPILGEKIRQTQTKKKTRLNRGIKQVQSLTRIEEEYLEYKSNQSVKSSILGGKIRQSQTQEKTRLSQGKTQASNKTSSEYETHAIQSLRKSSSAFDQLIPTEPDEIRSVVVGEKSQEARDEDMYDIASVQDLSSPLRVMHSDHEMDQSEMRPSIVRDEMSDVEMAQEFTSPVRVRRSEHEMNLIFDQLLREEERPTDREDKIVSPTITQAAFLSDIGQDVEHSKKKSKEYGSEREELIQNQGLADVGEESDEAESEVSHGYERHRITSEATPREASVEENSDSTSTFIPSYITVRTQAEVHRDPSESHTTREYDEQTEEQSAEEAKERNADALPEMIRAEKSRARTVSFGPLPRSSLGDSHAMDKTVSQQHSIPRHSLLEPASEHFEPSLEISGPNTEACGPSMEHTGPNMEEFRLSMVYSGPSMIHSGPSMEQSSPRMVHSVSNMEVSGPSIEHSRPNMEESGPSVKRSGLSMVHSGPSMEQSSPRMEESGTSVEQSGLRMVHSGSNMEVSGTRMVHSVSNMEESSPSIKQTGPRMVHSGSNMEVSGTRMVHSGSNMEVSGTRMVHSVSNMEESSPSIKQSGSRMEHSGANIKEFGPSMEQSDPRMVHSGSNVEEYVNRLKRRSTKDSHTERLSQESIPSKRQRNAQRPVSRRNVETQADGLSESGERMRSTVPESAIRQNQRPQNTGRRIKRIRFGKHLKIVRVCKNKNCPI